MPPVSCPDVSGIAVRMFRNTHLGYDSNGFYRITRGKDHKDFKKIYNMIFWETTIEIDVHGYHREGAKERVDNIIASQIKRNNNFIVDIVHGHNGGMILRNLFRNKYLNKYIIAIEDFPHNPGVTRYYICKHSKKYKVNN